MAPSDIVTDIYEFLEEASIEMPMPKQEFLKEK